MALPTLIQDGKTAVATWFQGPGAGRNPRTDPVSVAENQAALTYTLHRLFESINTTAAQKANFHAPQLEETEKVLNELWKYSFAAAEKVKQEEIKKERASKLTPLTEIFTPPAAPVAALPGHKDYKLPDFNGQPPTSEKQTAQNRTDHCLGWLARYMNLCKLQRFSWEVAFQCLERHCIDHAARVLKQSIRGVHLPELRVEAGIVALEKAFADLKHPDTAMDECRRAVRREGEDLMAMGYRIAHLARMATRDKTTVEQAEKEMDALATATFMSMLHPRVQEQLFERITARRKLGQDDPTFQTLLFEANEIEEKRIAAHQVFKTKYHTAASLLPPKTPLHAINRAEEEEPSYGGTSEQDEGQYGEDEEQINLVNRRTEPERPHYRPYYQRTPQGRTPFAGRPGRGGARGRDARGRFRASDQRVRRVEYEDEGEDDRPAESYDDGSEEGQILAISRERVTPQMVGVNSDECLRCGLRGHRAFGPDAKACPLREEYLVSTPCSSCHRGGHLASRCPNKVEVPKN
jgi:hypothetical protein